MFFSEKCGCLNLIVSATAEIPGAQPLPDPRLRGLGIPFTYIQKQPYLGEADTNTEFLPWVSDKAILDLTRAAIEADQKNYTGAAAYRTAAAHNPDDARGRREGSAGRSESAWRPSSRAIAWKGPLVMGARTSDDGRRHGKARIWERLEQDPTAPVTPGRICCTRSIRRSARSPC